MYRIVYGAPTTGKQDFSRHFRGIRVVSSNDYVTRIVSLKYDIPLREDKLQFIWDTFKSLTKYEQSQVYLAVESWIMHDIKLSNVDGLNTLFILNFIPRTIRVHFGVTRSYEDEILVRMGKLKFRHPNLDPLSVEMMVRTAYPRPRSVPPWVQVIPLEDNLTSVLSDVFDRKIVQIVKKPKQEDVI